MCRYLAPFIRRPQAMMTNMNIVFIQYVDRQEINKSRIEILFFLIYLEKYFKQYFVHLCITNQGCNGRIPIFTSQSYFCVISGDPDKEFILSRHVP